MIIQNYSNKEIERLRENIENFSEVDCIKNALNYINLIKSNSMSTLEYTFIKNCNENKTELYRRCFMAYYNTFSKEKLIDVLLDNKIDGNYSFSDDLDTEEQVNILNSINEKICVLNIIKDFFNTILDEMVRTKQEKVIKTLESQIQCAKQNIDMSLKNLDKKKEELEQYEKKYADLVSNK